jgi:hypothetical protein
MLQLRPDQIADLSFYIGQKKCMNLSDPGTGKTPSVCVNQFRRFLDDQLQTIWVQPKALMPKNKIEISRFTPFTSEDVAIVDGTKAKRLEAIRSGKRVLLMGPDAFKNHLYDIPSEYKAMDVDEFHMCFGGNNSQRTQAFYQYAQHAVEMVLMTGTLVNGRLDSAYPAIQAIEPNYYPFGYDQFIGAHAICDERGKPISWRNHDRIRQILGRHGIRRTFTDVFGHQEIQKEVQWVQMYDQQEELYRTFEKEALLELEHFMIDGTVPGVATTRARQIMEHPNHFPDLRDPENLPRVDIMPGQKPAKLEALEIDFADQLRRGEPMIVFAAYVAQQEQIAQVAAKMGMRVAPIMNGKATARMKEEADKGFVEGRYDLLVGSPPVCAIGFNWQFWGPKMIEVGLINFASLTYMDSDFVQGYSRAVRGKRKTPLRVKTQAYLDSIDIKVMSILERKSMDANRVDPTREVLKFIGG